MFFFFLPSLFFFFFFFYYYSPMYLYIIYCFPLLFSRRISYFFFFFFSYMHIDMPVMVRMYIVYAICYLKRNNHPSQEIVVGRINAGLLASGMIVGTGQKKSLPSSLSLYLSPYSRPNLHFDVFHL
jgi:hypothetical protein